MPLVKQTAEIIEKYTGNMRESQQRAPMRSAQAIAIAIATAIEQLSLMILERPARCAFSSLVVHILGGVRGCAGTPCALAIAENENELVRLDFNDFSAVLNSE